MIFKFFTTKKTEDKSESTSLLQNLANKLSKTKQQISNKITALFKQHTEFNTEFYDELEELLIESDLGTQVAANTIKTMRDKVKQQKISSTKDLIAQLKLYLTDLLLQQDHKLIVDPEQKPFIILMVGINGAGKTTTIGKLIEYFQQMNKSILIAAGDTYRAAATEQLAVIAERHNVRLVQQGQHSDAASVIYDALQAAKSKNIDIVIADTAGRLHTQENLMQELDKISKVIHKFDNSAPHQTLLVLDATIGQNSLIQAKEFSQRIKVDGIVLTKLDSTAKGGIIFNISANLKLPVKFIGVGERSSDLQEFDPVAFVNAIVEDDDFEQNQSGPVS